MKSRVPTRHWRRLERQINGWRWRAADQAPDHCPNGRPHHHGCRLTIAWRLDEGDYAKDIKVTEAEIAALSIKPAVFHGEWNQAMKPGSLDG
jgi:hypothetical protein